MNHWLAFVFEMTYKLELPFVDAENFTKEYSSPLSDFKRNIFLKSSRKRFDFSSVGTTFQVVSIK
jgi:hypothetical protein